MSSLVVQDVNVTKTDGGTSSSVYEGAVKVWSSYDQSTPAINDSFNVTSITDTSTGLSTINFTNNMGSTNYGAAISSDDNSYGATTSPAASSIGRRVWVYNSSTLLDHDASYTSVLGDLA